MSIEARIRDNKLLGRIVSPGEAVSEIRDGMTVATTGNASSGFPRTLLLAMADRLGEKGEKVALFCAGALGGDVEDALQRKNVVSRRLGSLGSASARKAVMEGRMQCLDVKSGLFPLQVARGDFGPVDVAIIEAVGITEEGHIVPSTALTDGPRWVQCAKQVIVEINPWVPQDLEGIHDVFLPDLYPNARPIPLSEMGQRIGTTYIPVWDNKIRAIVETNQPMADFEKSEQVSEENQQIANHFIQFLTHQAELGLLPAPLPPLEVGIGQIADAILGQLKETGFNFISLYLPGVTESVLDLIDSGKVSFVSATNLRMEKRGLSRFFSEIEKYRKAVILRPLDVINSGEVIRRLGVIALNSAIEVDLLGQVNSSHLMGVSLVGGIGGSYDYSRNARLSIFLTPSTTKRGDISCIVPLVAHVDHTEHDVDVVITELGVADLRGLDPMERAYLIVESCAHPAYRPALKQYLGHAKEKVKGRQPLFMDQAFSFHQRYAKSKTMRISD